VIECPIARGASLRPAAPALRWRDHTWTYRELDVLVRRWHGALARFGDTILNCANRQRAVVRSENRPEIVALVFAAARAGVEVALLNARLAEAELPPLLDQLGPALHLGELPGASPLADFASDARALEPAPIDPARVQTILFTSGTTGRPKAAQLTAGAHVANARASIETLRIDSGSTYLCNLPLFHVGGIATVWRCALAGATLSLQERFDAGDTAAALASGTTHASLVATTLQRLLDVRQAFPPSVRAVLVGGGPVPQALLARAHTAGLPALHTYGLTETASQVTAERLGDADGTTAGWPLNGVEVRIVDGEIEVRGPTVMLGYLGEAPVRGWFRTGDLGSIDGRGRLVVHARRNDLIVSGGENVYPAEVEAALLRHPDVVDCAVVPWPDEQFGQVGCAAIVARRRMTDSELREHCRALLAPFKVPRRFAIVDGLPRNAAGKTDRGAVLRLLQRAA
jgi:O-succinylbenzoic acid--CoA ligase